LQFQKLLNQKKAAVVANATNTTVFGAACSDHVSRTNCSELLNSKGAYRCKADLDCNSTNYCSEFGFCRRVPDAFVANITKYPEPE